MSDTPTERFRLSAGPGCADGYPATIDEARFITPDGSFPVPYGHFLTADWGGSGIGWVVGDEQGQAELPVVLGNLFHPQNPQGAKYTTANNHLKGMQTAGGNKMVMVDTQGAQSILLSNSNNKSTAIQVDFKGDGSVSIVTKGPIFLSAGGDITLEAKKNIALRAGGDISLTAQNNATVEAVKEGIALKAQKELVLTAVTRDLTLEAASKKLLAKAAGNIELTASGVAKISGQDVKLNNPG